MDYERSDPETRTLDISFSSEYPVQRDFGIEILSHAPDAIDFSRLNRNAPLLFNHNKDNFCGSVRRAYIKDGKGRAVIKVSKNRNDILNDLEDGVLSNVSVSYTINKIKEETRDGQRVYIATRWTPTEISFVSMPADPNVGVNRALNDKQPSANLREVEQITITKEKPKMENTNFNEMLRTANRHKDIGGLEIMQRVLDAGGDQQALNTAILDEMGKRSMSNPVNPYSNMEEIPRQEMKKYSLSRAINAVINNSLGNTFEGEVHRHLEKTLGRKPKGLLVPEGVLMRTDMTTSGNYLVGTQTTDFVDAFRNQPIVVRAGAQMINGLVGNLSIPAQTGNGTAEWVAEGNAASESNLTISQLTMTPHTLTGNQTFTRKLLLQSTPKIDQLVRNDLSQLVSVGIDAAALCGAGASYEPRGITYNANINLTSTGGTLSYAHLCAMEENLSTYNGLQGNLAFIMPPSVRKSLRQLYLNSTYGEIPLFQAGKENDMGTVLGYNTFVTNQLAQYSGKDCVIFGDFSQLMIGTWGAIDLIIDPYTESKTGNVVITIFADVDILIRHGQSFSVIRDLN